MQTILVTGCEGFIGSHVCESLLHSGYKVIGIDNFDDFYDKKVKVKNLSNYDKHERFFSYEMDLTVKADYVQLPEAYINANILGTNFLLDFMVKREIKKLLFASSSSVYGNNEKIPFVEIDEVNGPISPYAFTKRSCELMNYSYHHLHKIDIVNMRFFTVYGPRQRPDLAIHKFFNLIYDNEAIQQYGNGSSARDYTFVSDTVQGIISALGYILSNKNVYEIVNLGNNTPVNLKELIESIYKVIGVEPKVEIQQMKPGDVNTTYANINKANKLFGYQPQTTLKEGLEKFKIWFESEK